MANGQIGVNVRAPGLSGRDADLVGCPVHINPDYIVEFKDFLSINEMDTTNDYTKTVVEAGSGSHAIAVTATALGGILTLTNDDASADSISLQRKTTFVNSATKKMWVKARLKLDSVTLSNFLFGLVVSDTTPLAHTDGMSFRLTSGSAALAVNTTASSTTTTTAAVATLVADTYVTLGMYYDGSSCVHYYVDGTEVAAHSTNVPTVALRPTIHIANGSAVVRVCSVDYILVAQER